MTSLRPGYYQNELRDLRGTAMVGAVVSVFEVATTTPATIYSDPDRTPMTASPVPAAAGLNRPGIDVAANIVFFAEDTDDAGEPLEYDVRATFAGIDHTFRAKPTPAGAGGGLAPAGNTTIAIGTSITGQTSDAVGDSRGAKSWFSWACLLSNSQITFLRNAGVGGNTAAQILARLATDVVAYSPKNCIIEDGANDAYISLTTLASYAATKVAQVAALRAANIRPILCTVMQRSDVASDLVEEYNAFLHSYALVEGIDLINFHRAVLNPATGLTATANLADGLHPSEAGARLMGQAAATTLATNLPLWVPPLATHQGAHSKNLVPNGLLLNNGSGIGTGWAASGGTASIVAGDGVSVLGNWQRLTENGHTTQRTLNATPFTGHSEGDRLAFCGWFQSSCTSGDTAAIALYYFNVGLATIPVFNFPGNVGPCMWYAEAVVPAGGEDGGYVYLTLPAGAGGNDWIQVAQVTVLNLTALGIESAL